MDQLRFSNMAGRVTLLILMTGLFAAVWSSDHPPGKTAEPMVPEQYQHSESVRETTLHRWPISRYERVVDTSDNWVPEMAGTSAAESRSNDRHRSTDVQMMPLIARVLSGQWIDAGLQFTYGDLSALPGKSNANRITSQPASNRSSQR